MTTPHQPVTVPPLPDMPVGAIVVHLAMALGRIEEICYRPPAIGSRCLDILGAISTVKTLIGGGEPADAAPAADPPGPFGPRRPYAWESRDGDPLGTPPPAAYGPPPAGPPYSFEVAATGDRVTVPYVPGPSQDPACNACNNVHPFGTPCNTDTADTAVMDAVR